MWILDTVVRMIDAMALTIILAFFFGTICRHMRPGRLRTLLFGVVFGLVGVVVMLTPVMFAPRLMVDLRDLMIALPAAFAGPLAGLVSLVIVAGARLAMGFPAEETALLMRVAFSVMVAHFLGGWLWFAVLRPRIARPALAVLALVAAVEGLALLATDFAALAVLPGLPQVIAVQNVVRALGLALAAALILREERLLRGERAMADQALRDPLTGVLNRRGLEAAVPVPRPGAGLGVACIDVDRFKPINDRCGHAAGDAALQRLARGLEAALPPGGLVARLGGDEFALVFPAESPEAAYIAAWDCVVALRAIPRPDGDGGLSASIGLHWTDRPGALRDWLQRADAGLYRVKTAGGDGLHTSFAGTEPAPGPETAWQAGPAPGPLRAAAGRAGAPARIRPRASAPPSLPGRG